MRFDEFIMERMGYPWGENEPDKQTRRQAFFSIPPANRSCGFCLSSYDAPLVWTGKVS